MTFKTHIIFAIISIAPNGNRLFIHLCLSYIKDVLILLFGVHIVDTKCLTQLWFVIYINKYADVIPSELSAFWTTLHPISPLKYVILIANLQDK